MVGEGEKQVKDDSWAAESMERVPFSETAPCLLLTDQRDPLSWALQANH